MLGSDMLDTAVGTVFVLLLLSLISSAINELIERQLKNRATDAPVGLEIDPQMATHFSGRILTSAISADGRPRGEDMEPHLYLNGDGSTAILVNPRFGSVRTRLWPMTKIPKGRSRSHVRNTYTYPALRKLAHCVDRQINGCV